MREACYLPSKRGVRRGEMAKTVENQEGEIRNDGGPGRRSRAAGGKKFLSLILSSALYIPFLSLFPFLSLTLPSPLSVFSSHFHSCIRSSPPELLGGDFFNECSRLKGGEDEKEVDEWSALRE